MNGQFLTKTQLTKRWSSYLVERFFPCCTKEMKNPRHKRGAPMQLYDINKVRYIESLDSFKVEMDELTKKRIKRIVNKQRNN